MLLLILHWIACLWYVVIMDMRGDRRWQPPKDVDDGETLLYGGSGIQEYLILFYYSVLTLVANDLLPTNYFEVTIAALIILLGSIVIGILIGEFSSILSEISKKARQQNEEIDLVQSTMAALQIPEDIQA